MLFEHPEWMEQAACRGTSPGLFYPDRGIDTTPIKERCATCPVKTECLDHALAIGEFSGIWGGTSGRERKIIRSTRQRQEAKAS